MKLKFSSGNISDLKSLLSSLIPIDTDWKSTNTNTFQAKIGNNIYINYYSSTGTIQVQGDPKKVSQYENLIYELLIGNKAVEINTEALESIPEQKADIINKDFLSDTYSDAEIVIALVGAVGVRYKDVKDALTDRLKSNFNYDVKEIRISKDVIEKLSTYSKPSKTDQYNRILNLMKAGNSAREKSKDNAILALGAINQISQKRVDNNYRKAYIIDSIKHPDEVKLLREVYGSGFYLVGVFSDLNNRSKYLTEDLLMSPEEANRLITKDENDAEGGHGQHTSDTYHLSDFFVEVNSNSEKLKKSIWRFLDIIFGHPHITPLFEEFAMFMAFTSSLRSADLSRQVGAVLTQKDEIIATGANDVPKHGGGLYWPYFEENEFVDFPKGRDHTRGEDSNVVERKKIIEEIIDKAKDENIDEEKLRSILSNSRLKDLIEFGRVVHAEMETLMMCARNNISARGSVIYCTTFPCHNCAKHILAAGVDKVIYIEPYPKSKALDFHSESIDVGFSKDSSFTHFEPFIGIGPRKFFDLFSINFGSGRPTKRKDSQGIKTSWVPSKSKPKIQLFPISYIERESRVSEVFNIIINTF